MSATITPDKTAAVFTDLAIHLAVKSASRTC